MSEPTLSARAKNLIELRDYQIAHRGSDDPSVSRLQLEIDEAIARQGKPQSRQFVLGTRSTPPPPPQAEGSSPPPRRFPPEMLADLAAQYRDGLEAQAQSGAQRKPPKDLGQTGLLLDPMDPEFSDLRSSEPLRTTPSVPPSPSNPKKGQSEND